MNEIEEGTWRGSDFTVVAHQFLEDKSFNIAVIFDDKAEWVCSYEEVTLTKLNDSHHIQSMVSIFVLEEDEHEVKELSEEEYNSDPFAETLGKRLWQVIEEMAHTAETQANKGVQFSDRVYKI